MNGLPALNTPLTRLLPRYGCALLMVLMGMQARALPFVAAEDGVPARVNGGGGGALAALDDAELAGVTGEGIAIVAEDFRFQMKNTGYVEQIGSAPPSGSGFQRGDLRWYGLTLSGAGAADGLGWTGESCGHALCPLANTGFLMAPFDNPYLLRVFDKTGYDFQNNSVTRVVLEVVGPTNSDPYRWAFWGEAEVGKSGTTNSGLLQSQVLIAGKPVSPHATITRSTSTTTTQNVSDAEGTTYVYTPTTTTKNVVSCVSLLCTRKDRTSTTETYSTTTTGAGTLFRVFQNQDNNDRTLALNWHSRLSGDFRFSLAQTSGSAGALGSVPLFDNGTSVGNAPGLKFRNVNAYFPLGQLFYQSLILDDTQAGATAGNGNFVIELTRLPNQANAYNDFYSISTSALGCEDPRYSGNNCGYQRNGRPDRYRETHGYVRWGDWYPGNGANCGAAGTLCNTFDSTADGIIFSKATAAGTFTAVASRPDADAPIDNDPPVPVITQSRAGLSSVNLGDSRIEGLLIQHLKITTLGAGP